jgi:hypothetical protein
VCGTSQSSFNLKRAWRKFHQSARIKRYKDHHGCYDRYIASGAIEALSNSTNYYCLYAAALLAASLVHQIDESSQGNLVSSHCPGNTTAVQVVDDKVKELIRRDGMISNK